MSVQFTANKLHQKVKKLQMDLDAQNHVQSTIEDELTKKNRELDTKSMQLKKLFFIVPSLLPFS